MGEAWRSRLGQEQPEVGAFATLVQELAEDGCAPSDPRRALLHVVGMCSREALTGVTNARAMERGGRRAAFANDVALPQGLCVNAPCEGLPTTPQDAVTLSCMSKMPTLASCPVPGFM